MPLEIVKRKKEQKHRVSVLCKTFCLKTLIKGRMSLNWRKLAKASKLEISWGGKTERHNLYNVEPELFIKFSVRSSSLKTCTGLIRKLDRCSTKCVTEFQELGGLKSLFDVLERLIKRSLADFSDAYLCDVLRLS